MESKSAGLEQKLLEGKDSVKERRKQLLDRSMAGVVRLDQVEEKQVSWLWRERVPLGEVTTIEGEPEIGKSWLCFAIAAELSREGKRILYISNEDDAETVGKKRLRLLGATMENVFAYSDRTMMGRSVKLVLPRSPVEFSMLGGIIEAVGADVVFINPLTGFLPPGVHMGKAEEMRPILDCLTLAARGMGITFFIVRHFGKMVEQGAIGRGLGSIDIAGAARGMLYVTEHPDYTHDELEEEYVRHRLVFQAKLNVDMKRPPLAFRLRKDSFEWFETRLVSMHEAMRPTFDIFNPAEKGVVEEQGDALEALFASRWPEKEIELGVVKSMLGINASSQRMLREACKRLGVEQYHTVEKGKAVKQWLKWGSSKAPRNHKERGK